MPVLGEIVAHPVVAAIAAVIGAQQAAEKPADPCRPPAIRTESVNLAALPGPDSPACRAARVKPPAGAAVAPPAGAAAPER